MLIEATRIVLATGGTRIVEAGENRCWDSLEVDSFPCEVDDDRRCDICGEYLDPSMRDFENGNAEQP